VLRPVSFMLNPPSVAERIAFGRPVDPADDPDKIHLAQRPTWALVGRILLGAIFVVSGALKLTSIDTTAGYMASEGLPAASTLAVIVAVAEIVGGVSVIAGVLTRIGALGLFLYLIPVTVVFHDFWKVTGTEQQMQATQFLKNLAIMGGLALLVAHGPGRYSLDARLRRSAPV
jgi:putative oxidoreductase